MSFFSEVRSYPLTSRRGLERLYREQITKPDPISSRQFKRLTEEEQDRANDERIRFIHQGLTIRTPAFGGAAKQLASLYIQNSGTLHDKLSLGISGAPYLGKSHLLFELARYTANRLRRDVPDFIEREIVPCVIITVPSPTTSKGVLQEMMNFFEFDFNQGYTESKLRATLVRAMNAHGTRLLGFDEAHNMARGGPRTTEDTKNALRKLMQDVDATQAYAGIELRQNGLFRGVSGNQLSSRMRMVDLFPFTAASERSRHLWMTTLDHFEQGLCLIGNEPGTLRSLAPYLFNRTGGIMGELASVLRTAALSLIRDGAITKYGREQITENLLDEIPLGEAAEQRQLHLTDDDELDWPKWPLR